VSNHARRHKPIALDPPKIKRLGLWGRFGRALSLGRATGPVCVASVGNRVEADLMVGFLRSHGINAHLSADDAGGTDPIYQTAFGVRVLVAAAHASQARQLLEDADL
jgi:hypothetical protein